MQAFHHLWMWGLLHCAHCCCTLKSLPSRRVIKLWAWQRYVTGQSWQYLLTVGFSYYKWYQSQTPGRVPTRTLWITITLFLAVDLAIVQHLLSILSESSQRSRCLRPSNVCSSLWPRFEKKVLENESKEILKARLREIERNVIWHTSKRKHNGLNNI